jgi:hypothetical protein
MNTSFNTHEDEMRTAIGGIGNRKRERSYVGSKGTGQDNEGGDERCLGRLSDT